MTQSEAAVYAPEKSTIGRSEIVPFVARPVPAPKWLKRGMQALGAVAPGLAATAARQLFFHPLQAPMKPEQAAVLATGEPYGFKIRGRDVRGVSFGSGPTVFLIHGWGGHAGHMTSFVEPLVASGHRVVTVDMPAHGRSDGRLTSLIHFSDTVAAMAERFESPHAIIAHSFGAAAVTVALHRGLITQRVAFIAPPSNYRSFWSRFREGVGVSQRVFDRLVAKAQIELDALFETLHPETLAPQRTEPLLIVHDEMDREIDVGESMALRLAWPNAQLVTTRGLGHIRILADAPTVARVVDFVQARPVATRQNRLPTTEAR